MALVRLLKPNVISRFLLPDISVISYFEGRICSSPDFDSGLNRLMWPSEPTSHSYRDQTMSHDLARGCSDQWGGWKNVVY